MKKRMRKLFLVLLLTSFLLLGCWDDISIEHMNLSHTAMIDYKDGNYFFYNESANVLGQSVEEGKKLTFSVITSKGKTFIKARDDLNRRTSHNIFLGSTRVVIFTKNMAEKGIEEYLNRIRGEYDYRKSIIMVTTSTDPDKVFGDIPTNNVSVGDTIEDLIKNEVDLGNSFEVTVGDALQVVADQKAGFLLPEINLEEEENTLTGYSVFKDEKYMGVIPAKERKGAVYFLASAPRFFYEINYKDKKLIILATLKSKKIKPQLENEELKFEINMTFGAEITYMNKMTSFKEHEIEEITKELEGAIKEDIEKTLDISQKGYKCDYLGFYKYFRAYNQSKFKTCDWPEMYADAFMDVRIKASMKGARMLEIKSKE